MVIGIVSRRGRKGEGDAEQRGGEHRKEKNAPIKPKISLETGPFAWSNQGKDERNKRGKERRRGNWG